MDWNSLFHSKYLRGGLCAVLIAAILLGLWLPGTGLKEAQPDDPLQGEGVREITVLKLGENLEQLNTISVPSGGQTKSTEPNDKASETRPEETQPDSSADDGSDGQEDGDQGEDGGEISPSELSLVLTWHPDSGNAKSVSCAADNTQAFAVSSYELNEGLFRFSVNLTGTLAQDAKIVNGISITESTQTARELKWPSDSLIMNPAAGTDKEVYIFSFTVRTAERDVFFRYKITYQKLPDVQLVFHWSEGRTWHELQPCKPEGTVSSKIKNNQLSGGALPYKLELTGKDAANARIWSVSYTSDANDGGNLSCPDGSLPMKIPEGETSNTYRIAVNVIANSQNYHYEVVLYFGNDVTLQMRYTLLDGTQPVILCENGKTKAADTVYDDQLAGNMLPYEMSIVGSDADSVTITSVRCTQTGNGNRTQDLTGSESEAVRLYLNDEKTGQNNFTVEAHDNLGNQYTFKINIPYKPRGRDNVVIDLLRPYEGEEVPCGTVFNLSVKAWSEDIDGNVISPIPPKDTDAFIKVELWDEKREVMIGEVPYNTPNSGGYYAYDLIPPIPEIGDEIKYSLHVIAEDAYGNKHDEWRGFTGKRREPGQKIGDATILVDMTVLGIDDIPSIHYDVLADEPISYVVAKAIMGMDTGEPFGAASDTLGWRGSYAGTLDTGFYLQWLDTGYSADALEDSTWPGSTEEEVLDAIDARFGAGTGLATLWRCLYRNGLNKSAGSGSRIGEFDYTSGSGWMYSLDGTYYPGQSMSAVHLNDGDTLTLRYTLAYGWDIGGGSDNYGNIVGYCVTAINRDTTPRHQMEEVEDPDGSIHYVCHCCGLIEDCTHEHTTYKDLEDGTHILFCEDCQTAIGDPQLHNWTYAAGDTEDNHVCAECGATEQHFWKEVEGTNTATCTEPGVRTVRCSVCGMEKEEEVEAKGHTTDNMWVTPSWGHYQKCSVCEEEINRGDHEYVYESGTNWEDYICRICDASHGWVCDGTPTIKEATCQRIVYHCDSCGYDMTKPGTFDEYHDYVDGFCRYCGAEDPDHVPHEHDYHETHRVDPTCTEDGYIEYTCDCGDTHTDPLPATGHSWGEWTPAGDGEEVRYCGVCGAEDYRTTEADTYSIQILFLSWLFPKTYQK